MGRVKDSFWLFLILLLSLGALIQFYLGFTIKQNQTKLFILMPLLTPAFEGSSFDRLGLNTMLFLSKVGRLGPVLNLEDLRGGILLLQQSPGLTLDAAQKSASFKYLKAAYQNIKAIHALRGRNRILEVQEAGLQQELKKVLTPAQLDYLYENQSRAEEPKEEKAWEQLFKVLRPGVSP
jgi:hypothetical protein